MSDNDDEMVGRILTRREVITLFGAAGASFLIVGCSPSAATPNAESATAVAVANDPTAIAGATAELATVEAANTTVVPACVVRPSVTEGPYYVDEELDRADIRSDPGTGAVKAGALLALTFKVSQVLENSCTPFEGAIVDVWHCDAEGTYSDISDPGFDTTGQKYLRGYQMTDASGVATFTSIYPGWYSGRTVHIHFKVRSPADAAQAYEFTSQLFFDESLSDAVFAAEPYAVKGQRDTLNNTDSIYQDLLLLAATQSSAGVAATFDIGIDLTADNTQPGNTEGGAPGGGPGGGPGGPPPDGTPGAGGPGGPPPDGTAPAN